MIRCVALAAALVCGAGACREREAPIDARVSAPSSSGPPARVYGGAPGSFVDVVAGAKHGVVAIRSSTPVKSGPAAMFPSSNGTVADGALGTGFLVESHGVFVVTTDQIAAAAEAADLRVVLPDGTEVPAKVVGRDVRLDIALLSVDVPRLQALPLGHSDDLAVGEWLVVLGDPFGDEVTASVGIVSATGRDAAASLVPGPAGSFRTFVQTDARIHRGNAGGPVLDTAGQVVGIAVATGDRPGEVSFVIPIDRVREVLDALREHGQVARSWLGVLVKPVPADLATSLALPKAGGALVTELKPGSPAARAGLRAGDVIVTWGGRDVDPRALPWLVAATPPNQQIAVGVWRSGAVVTVPVVTERMPE